MQKVQTRKKWARERAFEFEKAHYLLLFACKLSSAQLSFLAAAAAAVADENARLLCLSALLLLADNKNKNQQKRRIGNNLGKANIRQTDRQTETVDSQQQQQQQAMDQQCSQLLVAVQILQFFVLLLMLPHPLSHSHSRRQNEDGY